MSVARLSNGYTYVISHIRAQLPGHAPVLEAIGLTKGYGTTVALDGVDFTVAAGEVFCLLGANGAGKTTVIHLFLGFTRPDAGTARVQGIDHESEKDHFSADRPCAVEAIDGSTMP